jgi:hypothetical protein
MHPKSSKTLIIFTITLLSILEPTIQSQSLAQDFTSMMNRAQSAVSSFANPKPKSKKKMSKAEKGRLKREARRMEKAERLKQNVKGFLNIMQNPDNSEKQRVTARKYLGDLVEKLRLTEYKESFKHLISEVEVDFDKTSTNVCDSYKGAGGHPRNYDTCKTAVEIMALLFLTQNLHSHHPTFDNIKKMTFNFLQDKINGIAPPTE